MFSHSHLFSTGNRLVQGLVNVLAEEIGSLAVSGL
jgi:hypothetical protein